MELKLPFRISDYVCIRCHRCGNMVPILNYCGICGCDMRNRKEYRNMNVMKTYKNRKKDYEDGFNAGVEQGVRESIKYILMAVIQYLGDKRGWKRERIFGAIMWLQKHAVMILEDYTTFPEVVEAVKDEYGILYKDNNFILLPEEEWNHG